jgi:chloride channel protein, CIC family
MSEKPAEGYLPLHPLRWLPEFWQLAHRRLQPNLKLLLLAILVGIVSGVGAMVFYAACQTVSHYALAMVAGYQQASPGGEKALYGEAARTLVPWMLLIVPTIGGLISGLIVYSLAPEAEGHGTDAAIDAYHNKGGNIRPRVPVIKIVASAITLGTGGSGGREGPIAQIGAGFGSFLGRALRLTARERRVLMAAGMGAGIAAIFRAPLAGALFAAEVLYRSPDFESDVIIPAGLSSVVAYCTFGLAFGWNALFTMPANFLTAMDFNNPWHLVGYTVLVPLMVVLATLYTRSFYGLTAFFHRVPIRRHFRPMIGAFLTGLVGLVLYAVLTVSLPKEAHSEQSLSVLSFGYGVLQNALTMDPSMEGAYSLAIILAAVALGKILTTGLTIGSGGSGGVFGPSMVIGGCGGGALGIVLHHLWPGLAPHPSAFVIVGMAGFFSAAAKTPFSTLVIVSEMTGGYNLLLPTLWVCTLTFLLADHQSIYRSQVESPALSPAHQGDYIRAVLADLFVRQFLKADQPAPALKQGDSLGQTIDRLAGSSYQALPVVDEQNHLLGMVNLDDVHMASRAPGLQGLVLAADLMRTRVVPLRPDDRLDRALELFVENDLEALPVVDGTRKLLGLVRRADITRSYLQRVHSPVTATA